MRSKSKLIAIFTLGLVLILAACGDNTATSTLVPLPATSGAGAGAATTTISGGASAATTTSARGGGANTTSAAGTSGSAAQLVAVNIPAIPGTTEVQINAADFANVGGVPGRGGAANTTNGVTPFVRVFSSDDVTATLTTNVETALTGAGYTRTNFGGGGGRGANGGTPGANPPANFTPPAGFTPRAGFTPPANFTPGAGGRGFGGGQGGFGIYQKDGAADIVYNITEVPADVTAMSSNRLFANLNPDVAQKLFDQVKSKKTLLIITAAPGLAQGFGNRAGGQGAGNGGNAVTPTPTTK